MCVCVVVCVCVCVCVCVFVLWVSPSLRAFECACWGRAPGALPPHHTTPASASSPHPPRLTPPKKPPPNLGQRTHPVTLLIHLNPPQLTSQKNPPISAADTPGEEKLVHLASRVMETDARKVEEILVGTKYGHLSQESEWLGLFWAQMVCFA